MTRSFLVLLTLFFAFGVLAQTQTQAKKQTTSSKIKTHRFPGGMCYLQRTTFAPDMVTFLTTFPEHLTVVNIENCMTEMLKNKWEPEVVQAPTFVDSLREARTANMSCVHLGFSQSPMVYQVRFSNLALTGKQEEILSCLSASAEAKDKTRSYQLQQQPSDYNKI